MICFVPRIMVLIQQILPS